MIVYNYDRSFLNLQCSAGNNPVLCVKVQTAAEELINKEHEFVIILGAACIGFHYI